MSFNAAIDQAAEVWFGTDLAESVSYGGSDIQAHLEYLEAGPEGVEALLTVQRSDVASPTYRDVVVADGATFYVVNGPDGRVIKAGDQVSWTVYLSRDERGVWR